MTKWRIGAVSYLNTKPLVYQLESLAPNCTITYDLPSRLADQLSAGALDVALIPSIEVFQNPNYRVVSNACIACRGPVWSVKLLSRCAPTEIRTVALDEGSRTSIALVRIMLEQQLGRSPEYSQLAIDEPWENAATDAVLVIGDRAMSAQSPEFEIQTDLGEWWTSWTGLPFVFALWVARASVADDGLGHILNRSRDLGVAHIREIAAAECGQYDLSCEDCLNYLTNHLHFQLGNRERQGLDLFYQSAARRSLAPDNLTLQFHDCQAT